MILKEWNQYSHSLDDVEEYTENLDFIEGIMEQMMMDVVSNEDWVIFDGIIESFMNIDVDSYEEVDEELLS